MPGLVTVRGLDQNVPKRGSWVNGVKGLEDILLFVMLKSKIISKQRVKHFNVPALGQHCPIYPILNQMYVCFHIQIKYTLMLSISIS